MTFDELTSKFDLTHTHTLVLESDNLTFKKVNESSKNASVYVWVACKPNDEFKVLYVGKAGKGVHVRCTQHMGGFINSGTGRKNAMMLKRFINEGYEVHVYARQSLVMDIFGKPVSLYSAEEDALCEALSPVLNRAVFPSVEVKGEKKQTLNTSSEAIDSFDAMGQLINNRLIQSTTVSTDDLLAQLDAYSIEQRSSVEKLLTFIDTQLSPDHMAKLIGGYSGQPKGCKSETTLTFAIPSSSGMMKPGTWQARVYFSTQLRVGLPLARLNSTAHDKVDISEKQQTFSPKSTDDFIQNPNSYLI
jgi:hypothetical protein